jgi:hypothetical protein
MAPPFSLLAGEIAEPDFALAKSLAKLRGGYGQAVPIPLSRIA